MTAFSKNLEGTRQLLTLAVKNQRKEFDSVYLIGGEEGKGKSTFVLDCVQIIEELKGEEVPIENITRTLKEMIVRMRHLKDAELLALDEGGELSSDLQYEGIVKAVKKMFIVMRQKSFIVFICFTNPLKVNTYFREDRVKGVFLITHRGRVLFYTRKTFMLIMERIKILRGGVRSISNLTRVGVRPDLIDTFPRYEGHLKKDYDKRKKENISKIFEDLNDEFGLDEKRYSLEKAAKLLMISPEILKTYLKEEGVDNPRGVLPFEWNLTKTKRRIKENDILDFKLWFEAQRKEQKANIPPVFREEGKGKDSQEEGESI